MGDRTDRVKNLFAKNFIFLAQPKLLVQLAILYKLKYLLPESAMLNLYYALVHSNLIYGILWWGNTFPSYLTKLSKLQNKAIRIVTGKNWNDSANPLYQKLNILPLVSLLNLDISKFVINTIN